MRHVFYLAPILLLLALCDASAFTNDGFVRVQGTQFALSSDLSHTFKIKGFNYFPQRHPWAIFSDWDPSEIQAELQIASELNSNVVRTFIVGGSNPGQTTIDRVVQFVQLCKAANQKAIISLFDGYGVFPAAGTPEEANNFAQIDALCAALKNDTGVFAWDIKNEPDWVDGLYWSWSLPGAQAEAQKRIDWLYRMRNRLKLKDPNHLVTVGLIFNYNNYLPSNTRTVESFVDFVCYHYYPRNYPMETFRQSIQSLKAHTSKPINVEEIGHNADGSAGATEQDQANLFAQWLSDIQAENISGLVQWTLCDWWDQWPGPANERYYGFIKADGQYTRKPAASVYRDNFPVEQFNFSVAGRLTGFVRDAVGYPVISAQVSAEPGGFKAKTSETGAYDFPVIPVGTYTLSVSGTGFSAAAPRQTAVTGGNTTVEEFTLAAAPPSIPAITNAGFEAGDPSGWSSWGQVDGVQSGTWFGGISAHNGNYFLGTATNWGHKNGGVYQQISVTAGKTYTLEVWSRTYQAGATPGQVANRIGVDPLGGVDPASPSVLWSQFTESNSQWKKLSVFTTATRPVLTVFLQFQQPSAGEWHINCFDDVKIYLKAVTCGEVNQAPDGWPVILSSGIVTAAFNDSFYLEDPSRAAGIKVAQTAAVSQGDELSVSGAINISNGERSIAASEVSPPISEGNSVPRELAMTSAVVGGKAAQGSPGGIGLYNTGLLVRCAGRVTWAENGVFYLDDGGNVTDNSGHEGIRIVTESIALPEPGSYVTVTGISCRQSVNGLPAPAIRTRTADDIFVH